MLRIVSTLARTESQPITEYHPVPLAYPECCIPRLYLSIRGVLRPAGWGVDVRAVAQEHTEQEAAARTK